MVTISKTIYWGHYEDETDRRFAQLHLQGGYNQNTLEDYLRMAKMMNWPAEWRKVQEV